MIPRELLKKIRHLEVRTKNLVEEIFRGEYHSAFKGRGIEFAEVRPYQMGDDVRSIDWNVTARMDETYIKTFEEERQQTLLLAVDISGSENFGSHNYMKRDLAAQLCAVLAFSAVQNNDNVGLFLFSDQKELFVPPKKGRRHVLRLIRDLFAHETASKGTDIASALEHIIRLLSRRSIVLLISDFLDEGYEQPLRGLARRHDTVAIQLSDPREEELPDAGLLRLADAETGATTVVDTASAKTREAFQQYRAERQKQTEALFRRVGVDTVEISTSDDFVEPLVRFFRHRNRRMSR